MGALATLIPLLKPIIRKVIPDREAAAKAEAELERAAQAGELNLLLKQIEVNITEARHGSRWVAGWRPGVGWICCAILANNYILAPWATAVGLTVPTLDAASIMPVLLGLLGLAGARSFEKVSGVAREK